MRIRPLPPPGRLHHLHRCPAAVDGGDRSGLSAGAAVVAEEESEEGGGVRWKAANIRRDILWEARCFFPHFMRDTLANLMKFLIFTLYFLSYSSVAMASCVSEAVENFHDFFEKFSKDKKFAISRTNYPVDVIGIHYREKVNGKYNGAQISQESISIKQDISLPSLNSWMNSQSLRIDKITVLKNDATVDMSNSGKTKSYYYRFSIKKNCWYFMYSEYSDR